MFELRLILESLPDGTKLLRLTRGFRIVFGLIAALIAVGSYTTGTISTLPVVLGAISLLATCYVERWHFSRETGEATRAFGLAFLYKTVAYRFDTAQCFEYARFLEGSGPSLTPAGAGDLSQRRRFQRQFETLSLVLADGDRVDIEKQRGRSHLELRDTAEKLAEYCGVPLEAK